jgi:hypothetical protein
MPKNKLAVVEQGGLTNPSDNLSARITDSGMNGIVFQNPIDYLLVDYSTMRLYSKTHALLMFLTRHLQNNKNTVKNSFRINGNYD